jgi:hypothetical protein
VTASKKIVAFVFGVLPLVACGASLTAQDKATLAAESVQIAVCEQAAEDCAEDAGADKARRKACWAVFDTCIAARGIDGGRHGR